MLVKLCDCCLKNPNLKVNLFHLQVRPFWHLHLLPFPVGFVSKCVQACVAYAQSKPRPYPFHLLSFTKDLLRSSRHFSADSQLLLCPESIEAILEHPVRFFFDLPNFSNDVLTKPSPVSPKWIDPTEQFWTVLNTTQGKPRERAGKNFRESAWVSRVESGCLGVCIMCLVQTLWQGLWFNIGVESCSVLLSKCQNKAANWPPMHLTSSHSARTIHKAWLTTCQAQCTLRSLGVTWCNMV